MTHNRVRQQIININDRTMSVKDIVHELPWIHHNHLTLFLYHHSGHNDQLYINGLVIELLRMEDWLSN